MQRLLLLIVVGMLAFAQAPSDLNGIWSGEEVDEKTGEVRDVAFRFKQTGRQLTGMLYFDHKFGAYVNTDIAVEDGLVEGTQVSFVVRSVGYTGKVAMLYQGQLKGNELHLQREWVTAKKKSDDDTKLAEGEGTAKKSKPPVILKKKI